MNLAAFIVSSLFLLLSAAAVSFIARLEDAKSIATFRRVSAALLGGEGIWLFFAGIGFVLAYALGNQHVLGNAVVFGAFAAAGFEFIIINGAFAKNLGLSMGLAALHPILTIVTFRFTGVFVALDWYAAVLGLAAWAALVSFIVFLKRHRTSLNHDAVTVFQAFMKTWAGRQADELEEIIKDHSEQVAVSTKVIRIRQGDHDLFLVLPGVHPGPFYPVGSYNLPGLIHERFKDLGPVLTLHRPGGHDRNIATRKDTEAFVSEVHDFAKQVQPGTEFGRMKGPLASSVSKAKVTFVAIKKDVILTVSFAPAGSEDLAPAAEESISAVGGLEGFDVSVVDAHNSIEPKISVLDTSDQGWKQLFIELKKCREEVFEVGYAHSSELDFAHKEDITSGGVGVLLFAVGGRKWVLVLADANNADPNLRDSAAAALRKAGYDLFELCTTDSHDLAARGMTITRGYFALGEATPINDITKAITDLTKIAESRLSSCKVGSGTLKTTINAFGTKALDEFDELARAGSAFGKTYLRVAILSILGLYLAALAL